MSEDPFDWEEMGRIGRAIGVLFQVVAEEEGPYRLTDEDLVEYFKYSDWCFRNHELLREFISPKGIEAARIRANFALFIRDFYKETVNRVRRPTMGKSG